MASTSVTSGGGRGEVWPGHDQAETSMDTVKKRHREGCLGCRQPRSVEPTEEAHLGLVVEHGLTVQAGRRRCGEEKAKHGGEEELKRKK
jgi:hypothetical protein